MQIRSYTHDSVLTDDLIRFLFLLYEHDPNWVPPLKKDFHAMFSPYWSFYRKPGNFHRHFMAVREDRTLGHISALVNDDLKDRDGTPIGAIGFFECVEEYAVAAELLWAAVEWLRKEQDIQRIWGPINFDIWHGYRFMTQGFAEGVFYGEPYNKPYYPIFFTRYGFRVRQRWHSLALRGVNALEDMIAPWKEQYVRLTRAGYRFEPIDLRNKSDLATVHKVLTRSYHDFLGYTPFAFEDFERIFAGYGQILNPRLTTLMYNPDGLVAGFAVAYPDYADAVRALHGETNLLAKVRYLWQRRSADRVVFYMIGLTPEEIATHRGLGRAGFYHMMQQILREGYEAVVMALIAEGGPGRKHIGSPMTTAQREYSLFQLDV